jgi:hypothetical protein
MRIVKKLLSGWGRKETAEQGLTVHLELVGGDYGSEDEVEAVRLLGDDCEQALAQAGAGVFEGEEFGDRECVLVFTARDAGEAWRVIEPHLRASSLSRGARVMQRATPTARPRAISFEP